MPAKKNPAQKKAAATAATPAASPAGVGKKAPVVQAPVVPSVPEPVKEVVAPAPVPVPVVTPLAASAPALPVEPEVQAVPEEKKQEEVEEEEEFEDCEGMDDPLAMLGGMGEELVYKVTAVPEAAPPVAETMAAAEAEVEPPAAAPKEPVVDEEASCEAFQDPLEMLSGMGEEQVYKVTMIEEAEVSAEADCSKPAPELPAPTPTAAADVQEEICVPALKVADVEVESELARTCTGGSGSSPRSNAGPEICHVTVVCESTQPGDCVALVGSGPALGDWDISKAVRLSTSADSWPAWSGELPVPTAGSEFKVVIIRGTEVVWEPIPDNRTWPTAIRDTLATFGR
mmetsp:Transcript_152899/g.490500  ORF Transcript_152899/g.490500 Transcript_152899/m.490500 type:complete len:343 (+) Transcript_152899:83-1111(+)